MAVPSFNTESTSVGRRFQNQQFYSGRGSFVGRFGSKGSQQTPSSKNDLYDIRIAPLHIVENQVIPVR